MAKFSFTMEVHDNVFTFQSVSISFSKNVFDTEVKSALSLEGSLSICQVMDVFYFEQGVAPSSSLNLLPLYHSIVPSEHTALAKQPDQLLSTLRFVLFKYRCVNIY
jgi:hypothetical protein